MKSISFKIHKDNSLHTLFKKRIFPLMKHSFFEYNINKIKTGRLI